MNQPKPLKRFGQNYLVDQNIIRKIITEFNPLADDVVLEIGPGTGALTSHLVDSVNDFYAVEVDKRVVDDLRARFPKAHFVNADFLKTEIKDLVSTEKKIRFIGNIPYNITSPIVFKLMENRNRVKDAMFMVQLEVARRMTAKEKSDDYGILGVLLNYFATTKLCFKISPNVFYPKPKVHSAVVHMDFNRAADSSVNDEHFISVVKAAFGNRRKTLKNSLSNSIFGKTEFMLGTFDLTRRAEELSINEFVELAKLLNVKQK